MSDLSKMTAADLLAKLAKFESVTVHRLRTGDQYHEIVAGLRILWHRARRDGFRVGINPDGACMGTSWGVAPTLAKAMEKALRKVDGNE